MITTVIVVTLNRPEQVRRCLECLKLQRPLPNQVIVVDASPNDITRDVVNEFDQVQYLRNGNGIGRMTASRNMGLRIAKGDIIAFIDDDAFVHEGWLIGVMAAFDDPNIAAVGGRALNNQPNEATIGVNQIGRLLPNGSLVGNFAADPGKVIDVDHIIGCNMSFRSAVLGELGGFREDYPGISGVREDSDMCVRIRRRGYRIRFTPYAVVTHIGAPQLNGQRFDWRYAFYSAHNHSILLVRNFGLASGIVWRSAIREIIEMIFEASRKTSSAFLRLSARATGLTFGTIVGLRLLLSSGRDPVRRDRAALDISRQLSQSVSDIECDVSVIN